jgi:hypothetical protein
MLCGSCKNQLLEEHWFLQEPHGITSQKTAFLIGTAMKTSNLMKLQLFLNKFCLFVFEPILLFEGLHLVLSFVPNHSSKRHPWFVKSENNDTQYKDYYIWSSEPPTYDSEGKPEPPNNWVCMKLHTCNIPNKIKAYIMVLLCFVDTSNTGLKNMNGGGASLFLVYSLLAFRSCQI